MNKRRAEVLYGGILDSVSAVKEDVTSELMDAISSIVDGGGIPTEAAEDLKVLNRITAESFAALERSGIPATKENGKYKVLCAGKTFTCPENVLQKFLEKENTEEPIKRYSLPKNKEENDFLQEETRLKEPAPVSPVQETSVQEDPVQAPSKQETPENPVSETHTSAKAPEVISWEDTQGTNAEELTSAPAPAPVPVPEAPAPYAPQSIYDQEVFMEEAEKPKDLTHTVNRLPASNFVFDSYRISVAHGEMRGGGKPEEMIVYIAPLKIQKFECPSSPILVAIFYRGKMYAKSSLDIVSDGKNTVEIDVNEYYFLCRGKFDDKGQFRSFINTTGISATQRDILTIISRDSQPVLPGERLGHLKLPYNPVVSDGTGNIEIFPLDPEDNEFVIIVSNKEFVDYYFMTDDRNKGLQRVLINDTDGRKELVCNWDGGFLEAELIDG